MIEPGYRLDILIHKHVFELIENFRGSQTVRGLPDVYGNEIDIVDTEPSKKIEHAWAVVERLKQSGWILTLNEVPSLEMWECVFQKITREKVLQYAPTAPQAICLSALKAKGVEIED